MSKGNRATSRWDYGNLASTMKRISCIVLEAGCHLFGTDSHKKDCDTEFWGKSYMSEVKFSIYNCTETSRIFKNNLGGKIVNGSIDRESDKKIRKNVLT